jgi:hypothetical protein
MFLDPDLGDGFLQKWRWWDLLNLPSRQAARAGNRLGKRILTCRQYRQYSGRTYARFQHATPVWSQSTSFPGKKRCRMYQCAGNLINYHPSPFGTPTRPRWHVRPQRKHEQNCSFLGRGSSSSSGCWVSLNSSTDGAPLSLNAITFGNKRAPFAFPTCSGKVYAPATPPKRRP